MNKLKKKMLVFEESLISSNHMSRVNPLTLGRCQKLKGLEYYHPKILGAENELTNNNPQKWGTAAPQPPNTLHSGYAWYVFRWLKELCNAL